MNLIKFKDNIRPGDAYFNTYLKDQYAYWVRMRYVIPMSVISIHDYVSLERDIDLLNTLDPIYWDLEDPSDLKAYIDEVETNKINDPKTYEHHNRMSVPSNALIASFKTSFEGNQDGWLAHPESVSLQAQAKV